MIRPNMYLGKHIFHCNKLLLRAGTTNLERFVGSLQQLGITHIYIEDKISDGIEISDIVSEETRLRCQDVLYMTISRFTREGCVDTDDIQGIVEDILEELLLNPDMLLSLNDIGTTDDSTLSHSVNTTIYALILGRELAYSKLELKKLAEGTLLHDIGKTLVNPNILYKPAKLTPEEFDYIKKHTTLGYEILKKKSTMTEWSRMIALTHHERLDGSGYPNGLKGDEIQQFSRIVAIADVYEALTADRCYRAGWTNLAASEELIKEAANKLDASLTAKFISKIAIYPNGSIVKLSNNEYGIVKEQNANFPYSPIIRVFSCQHGIQIPLYEIDLSKELNIIITQSDIEFIKEA